MTIKGIWVQTGQPLRIDVSDGRIAAIESLLGEEADKLPYLSPGFFDIQVNGYRDSDYSQESLNVADIEYLVGVLDAAGTTRHLPTMITSSKDRLLNNLRILTRALDQDEALRTAIPGYHMEGPFISPEDGPRGAHDARFVRNPDFDEFQAWQEAAEGRIRLVTLAPERPGALEFIRRVSESGARVALGHSAASAKQIQEAVAAGAVLSTHLGNGSHEQLPRLKNYVWEQLAADGLMASIISDGFHLPPAVVKVFGRAKELKRLILISDVALLAGKSPGVYQRGAQDIQVFEDDHLGLPGTGILAGAAHLLDWDIAHFIAATGSTVAEAVRLCTENPERLLGLNEAKEDSPPQSPIVGSTADLVVFRPGTERLRIETTIRNGQAVYSR